MQPACEKQFEAQFQCDPNLNTSFDRNSISLFCRRSVLPLEKSGIHNYWELHRSLRVHVWSTWSTCSDAKSDPPDVDARRRLRRQLQREQRSSISVSQHSGLFNNHNVPRAHVPSVLRPPIIDLPRPVGTTANKASHGNITCLKQRVRIAKSLGVRNK